jgi:subtilisin family serine protease
MPPLIARAARSLPIAASAALLAAAPAAAAPPPREPETLPGRYIVVFDGATAASGRATDRLEREHGFTSRLRYGRALKGFAARLTAGQVRALHADSRVAYVAPDRPVRALGSVPLAAGDSTPTGVRRLGAGTATTAGEASGAGVAVIDTGIDLSHPDLAATNGVNCVTPGAPAQDDNGHGTHVAGTIGARNDGAGVVGVAPGTRTYAVKVLDAAGSGAYSQIICGIDWVTATRTDTDPANDIAVVNMSLGGAGAPFGTCAATSDPMYAALCASVAAGVTYVVAAGNDGWDFDYAPAPDTPAAYPEALTVTAMADSDGRGGAVGGAPACTSGQLDDRYATFSNFAATAAGAAHAIAAPGVCIRSTWPGGGHATISGTSMAAPHVAALAALCIAEGGRPGPCAGLPPAQVIARLRAEAQGFSAAQTAYGFTGDPLRAFAGASFGYLAHAPAADTVAPAVTTTSPAGGATAVATSAGVAVTFSEAMDKATAEAAFFLVRAVDGAAVPGSFSWSGATMTFRPAAALAEGTAYRAAVGAGARDTAGNGLTAARSWSFTTVRTLTLFPDAVGLQSGSLRAGGVSSLRGDDNLFLDVASTSWAPTTAWYGRFPGVPRDLTSLRVAYAGRSSASCSQTVAVWRWATGTWVQLDARTAGTAEALVDRAVGGVLTDYVNSVGEARVRVRCTSSTAAFVAGGDLLRLTVTRP